MVKCSNFVCLNETKVGKKFASKFCKSCRLSGSRYVFECQQCKNIFTGDAQHMGRIPLTCSQKCRNRRRYINSGSRWSKLHRRSPNRTKVKKEIGYCKYCNEKFEGYSKRKFCSKKCYGKYTTKYGNMVKIYACINNVTEKYLSQIEPQEVLYVSHQ